MYHVNNCTRFLANYKLIVSLRAALILTYLIMVFLHEAAWFLLKLLVKGFNRHLAHSYHNPHDHHDQSHHCDHHNHHHRHHHHLEGRSCEGVRGKINDDATGTHLGNWFTRYLSYHTTNSTRSISLIHPGQHDLFHRASYCQIILFALLSTSLRSLEIWKHHILIISLGQSNLVMTTLSNS